MLLVATVAVATADWLVVSAGNRRLEYVAKPGTMVVLIALALTVGGDGAEVDGALRAWFVIALVCSLAGDVFLMLPSDWFVAGLASFLLGHLAYIAGLATVHESWPWSLVGLLLVGGALALVAHRILGGVRRSEPAMSAPVIGYMAVISVMVVAAWGTVRWLAIAGATLFYASDATLAWNRFVHEHRRGRLAVMVTYHLGQIGLVLSLVQ